MLVLSHRADLERVKPQYISWLKLNWLLNWPVFQRFCLFFLLVSDCDFHVILEVSAGAGQWLTSHPIDFHITPGVSAGVGQWLTSHPTRHDC